MNKTILIFGTRPELIKLVPLINEFEKRGLRDQLIVVNTNQHHHLLDQVIEVFKVKIDYHLKIDNTSNNLSVLSSEIIRHLDALIQKLKTEHSIDSMIVQGDTSTTYCSAMVAFYNKIEVHYIEAGLRTYDIFKPFPEEFHRRAISHTAKYLYAPTESARQNLLNEGFPEERIIVSGNTLIDTLKIIEDFPDRPQHVEKNIVLCTMHRRENQGERFAHYIESIIRLSKSYPHYTFVIIKHPNPGILNVLNSYAAQFPDNIALIHPVPYRDMIELIRKSKVIITDSGGLQEEASYFLTPIIILRESTERIESVQRKIAVCHSSEEGLEALFVYMKDLTVDASNQFLYGDGNAAALIVDQILQPVRSKLHRIELTSSIMTAEK